MYLSSEWQYREVKGMGTSVSHKEVQISFSCVYWGCLKLCECDAKCFVCLAVAHGPADHHPQI